MNEFKVGDKVKCIKNKDSRFLEKGKEYIVEMIVTDNMIKISNFPFFYFYNKSFKLVEEAEMKSETKTDSIVHPWCVVTKEQNSFYMKEEDAIVFAKTLDVPSFICKIVYKVQPSILKKI